MTYVNASGQKQSGTVIVQDEFRPERGDVPTEHLNRLSDAKPLGVDHGDHTDLVYRHILRVHYELGQKPVPTGIDEPARNNQFRQFATPEWRGDN